MRIGVTVPNPDNNGKSLVQRQARKSPIHRLRQHADQRARASDATNGIADASILIIKPSVFVDQAGGVLDQQNNLDNEVPEPTAPQTVWQENHGNLLLAFVAIVFVIGAIVLIYRQTRFVAPRFPESESIAVPMVENSQTPPVDRQSIVTIKVTGAVNDSGNVKVAIYDTPQDFNDPTAAALLQSCKLADGETEWNIPVAELPAKFAIAAYHDENDDGQLNSNRFGIPTERYGYSRNARGLTGPPGFNEAVQERPNAGTEIVITIR